MEVLRGRSLQVLVFQLPSCVQRLRRDGDVLDCRKHLLLTVKRDNPWSKIESFFSLAADVDDRCAVAFLLTQVERNLVGTRLFLCAVIQLKSAFSATGGPEAQAFHCCAQAAVSHERDIFRRHPAKLLSASLQVSAKLFSFAVPQRTAFMYLLQTYQDWDVLSTCVVHEVTGPTSRIRVRTSSLEFARRCLLLALPMWCWLPCG